VFLIGPLSVSIPHNPRAGHTSAWHRWVRGRLFDRFFGLSSRPAWSWPLMMSFHHGNWGGRGNENRLQQTLFALLFPSFFPQPSGFFGTIRQPTPHLPGNREMDDPGRLASFLGIATTGAPIVRHCFFVCAKNFPAAWNFFGHKRFLGWGIHAWTLASVQEMWISVYATAVKLPLPGKTLKKPKTGDKRCIQI